MGLFDFASDIGKKVFGIGDADAAEKIKQDIETNNPGIENLEVIIHDETVCQLKGTCKTAEAKEKAILMAGNMKGISGVLAGRLHVEGDPLPVSSENASGTMEQSGELEELEEQQDAAFEASTGTQYYTIESGDTLWGIAAKFLGNGSKYPEIFEANREVIEDPDKIFVGQKIRIPSSS